MKISLRIQLITGAAALLSLVLIGVAFFFLHEIGPGPASLLPAERTLMLVTNMTPDLQQKWKDTLPDLKDAPLHETGTPVAALVRTGNKREWVTFDAHGTPSVQGDLIQEGERPLSADGDYSRLDTTYTPTSAWLFARFPETSWRMDGLVTPSSPLAISIGTGSLRLAWADDMPSGFGGPIPAHNSGSILTLSAANVGSFLRHATAILHDSSRMPVQALLRSWVSRTVGNDISMTYDLAALLNGPGTLIMTKNADVAEVALRVFPQESSEELVQRMEEGALSAVSDAQHVERTFDEKFTFETMQAGAIAAPTETEEAGWTIRTIVPHGFLTARHGREWTVATATGSLTLLTRALMSSAEHYIAGGLLDQSVISALLTKWHIPLSVPWSLIPGTGNSIKWTLEQQGSLAVLTMKRL